MIACEHIFADEKHLAHRCLRRKDHEGACVCWLCGRSPIARKENADGLQRTGT